MAASFDQGPAPESYYVAVDLGATSGRVVLARLARGTLSLREIHRFPNEPVAYQDGLYWDIQRLWLEIQNGLRCAAALPDTRIVSIGVDSWGVDFALLGEGGVLLENPHHYRDPRTDGVVSQVLSILGSDRVYRSTGVQFFPFNTLYQLYSAFLKTPRLVRLAESLVTIPDLINFWLTGIIGCEYSNATTTQFLDCRTRQWACDLLAGLQIPTHFLPPVMEPGTVLGPLQQELASQLALPEAIVALPACHDTASAVAAVTAREHTAFISSGTWSLVGTEVMEPVVSAEAQRCNFANEGGVCGAFMLLKNVTGLWLLEGCRRKWRSQGFESGWDELLRLAATSDSAFEHLLDPDDPAFVRPEDMTAAIDCTCRRTGQRTPGSVGAYTRAVLDSLALKYRLVIEGLESVTGRSFDTVRVIGGGSQNALLNQFTANATGRRVLAGHMEATSLGNVGVQMLATGAVSSIDEARDLIERSFPPVVFQPESTPEWERAYRRFKDIVSASAGAPGSGAL